MNAICVFIWLFANLIPLLIFICCFSNSSVLLIDWIASLSKEISTQRASSSAHFDDICNLLDTLKLASKTFSSHMFMNISLGMLIVIVLVFRSVSFIMSKDEFTTAVMCFSTGLGFFNISFIYLIITLNITSAYLEKETRDLRESLNNILFPKDFEVYVRGESVSANDAKHMIIENLKEYKGYDGLGYFNLGRPLLTAIMANFATYFIVLVQFKLTEMTMM